MLRLKDHTFSKLNDSESPMLMQAGKWIMHVWKYFVAQQIHMLFGLIQQRAPLHRM